MKRKIVLGALAFLAYLICAQILLVYLFTSRVLSTRGLGVALALVMLFGFVVCAFVLLRLLRKRVVQSPNNPSAALTSAASDSSQTRNFENIWYSPRKSWNDLHLLTYRDVGTLTISGKSLKFQGQHQTIVIENILRLSYGKQGRDFVNNWVRVDYGSSTSPSTALFADGNVRGWSGVLGGTKRIFDVLTGLADGC